jgi:hypothetical protein
MKRTMLTIILSLTSSIGYAALSFHSIARLQVETFRPGWPPDFYVVLEDWGLRGPVECVTSAEEGDEKKRSDTLCFDRQGRLSTVTLKDYVDSRIDFTYDGRYLRQMSRRLDSGEVYTTVFDHDAAGYLIRALQTSTVDLDQRKRFRKERLNEDPDDPDVRKNQRGLESAREEQTFQYDSNGFIARVRCEPVTSDRQCVEGNSEYTVDPQGRPLKVIGLNMVNALAPLDLNAPPGPTATPRVRFRSEYIYDDRLRSVMRSNQLDGKLLAEIALITDESGDVEIEMVKNAYETTAVKYRYTYDSHRNWIRRDARHITKSSTHAVVRELTYWDR